MKTVVTGFEWYSNDSLNEIYPLCNYDEKHFNQTANECYCTALEDSRNGIFIRLGNGLTYSSCSEKCVTYHEETIILGLSEMELKQY